MTNSEAAANGADTLVFKGENAVNSYNDVLSGKLTADKASSILFKELSLANQLHDVVGLSGCTKIDTKRSEIGLRLVGMMFDNVKSLIDERDIYGGDYLELLEELEELQS